MGEPLTVSLPPGLELWDGCEIDVSAVNPATGADVSGVQVRRISLFVDDTGGGSLDFGPFMLVTGPSG